MGLVVAGLQAAGRGCTLCCEQVIQPNGCRQGRHAQVSPAAGGTLVGGQDGEG